jgi:biopolymer transport protein ExbD
MNFSKAKTPSLQFQLAPMIDVVFLLLCFFITSTLFAQWETEIDITLPTAVSGETPRRLQGEIILNIFPDGRVVVNQRTLDEAALAEFLIRIADLFPGHAVVLRTDEATPFRYLMRVMDLCRRADIYNISFATGIPE